MLFLAVLLVVASSAARLNVAKHQKEKVMQVQTMQVQTATGFTPIADPECEKQKLRMDLKSAYFAALHEDDNVINVLFDVDLSAYGASDWYDDTTFYDWYENVWTTLGGLFEYPSFRSTVARLACCWKKYVWCRSDNFTLSNHVQQIDIEDEPYPGRHVLSLLGKTAFGPYFPLELPRWQVRVYRYISSWGTIRGTSHVYIHVRLGHMLADGISLVSMLLHSVMRDVTPAQSTASAIAGARTSDLVSTIVPTTAIPTQPSVEIGRFDIQLPEFKQLYRELAPVWKQDRVTVTTLLQAAVLRAMSEIEETDTFLLAMPRDDRADAMNKAASTGSPGKFKGVTDGYARDLIAGSDPNIAVGRAHYVPHACRGRVHSLDAWRTCYESMAAALSHVYAETAQIAMEAIVGARTRVALQKIGIKKAGAADWMLSSINAGPQHSSIVGEHLNSQTVFLKPDFFMQRTIMLMTAGNKLSVGIMSFDIEDDDLVAKLQQQISNLGLLYQDFINNRTAKTEKAGHDLEKG